MWIGVHYEYPFGGMMADRPEWKPKGEKDWRRDLKAIRDTGFNLIRIRVGLDTNIDDIETLLEICRKLDLKVVFGSAMFYVHDDFVKKYPDSAVVWANGTKTPREVKDYTWPRACIHHPIFRRDRNALWEACARRFAGHPTIIAWDVHNEPSFCGCYCENTVAVFRKAVEREFGGIEGYNRAFGTTFASLGDLTPPKDRGSNIAGHRHWRMFAISELNRYLNEARDIVRKYVPDLPVSYNPTDPFSPMWSGQDWWNLKQYDFMSCSLYWGSGEHTPKAAATIELMKALGAGKDTWIFEFQGGPFFNPSLLTGKHMVNELNAAFAHGIKGLIYYRWDPLLTGPEPWINGLVEVDTDDTERRLALKDGIAKLRKLEPLIDRSRSPRPSVGLFLTHEQILHSSEFDYELRMRVSGHYGMLSALGYEMAVVLDEFDPATCPYDAMIFPYMFIGEALIPKIKAYAKSGRLAIVELPGQDIEAAKKVGAAFGLNVTGREEPKYWFVGWDLRGTGEKPGAAKGKYMGFAEGERLFFEPGNAKVLAVYGEDGKPAAVLPHGHGNILVAGFPIGRTYDRMLHEGLRNFVGSFLRRKVKPDIVVKGAHDAYRAMIDARVLESDREGLLFVINRGLYDYDLEIAVKGYKPVKVKSRPYEVVARRLQKTANA